MKFLRSLLMGTGGVVLAGLVLALLAPRAVHAVVATAVQVVNTSASPAITQDTSRQASQIVTVSCALGGEFAPSFAVSCVQILPNAEPGPITNGGYVVPANQYFVLTGMDTVFNNGATPTRISIWITSGPVSTGVETVLPQAAGQISFSSGIAAGPGAEVSPVPYAATTATVTLHGYLTSN